MIKTEKFIDSLGRTRYKTVSVLTNEKGEIVNQPYKYIVSELGEKFSEAEDGIKVEYTESEEEIKGEEDGQGQDTGTSESNSVQ